MAVYFLQNSTSYLHDQDLTTFLKKVGAPKVTVDDLDSTAFGATTGYRSRVGGLRNVTSENEGMWDPAIDLALFSSLGTVDRVVTVCPGGAETNIAYLFQADTFNYEAFGAVGDLTPFTLGMAGTTNVGVVRGQLAKAKANVSSTGQLGSILTLTAPTATQYVYATVHIFSVGTTITIQVQSDDNAPFASATTRATIGPLTVAGGTWMTRVIGPFAGETFWRMNVSAITGTFSIAGAIGVQ